MRRATVWAGVTLVACSVAVAAWLLVGSGRTSRSTERSGRFAASGAASPRSNPESIDLTHSPAAGSAWADVGRQDAEAGRADAKPAVRDTGEEPAASAHVAGLALDDLGNALSGHAVEIYCGDRSPAEAADLKPDRRVVTGPDGSFRVDGLPPGANELRLIGPGAGDALEACIVRWGRDCSTRLATEERRLHLLLPDDGLDRVAVVVRGHGDRLVTFRVVDDVDHALANYCFGIEGHGDDVVFRSDESGVVCEPVAVQQDQSVRICFLFSLADDSVLRSDERHQQLMRNRYGPVELQVQAGLMYQDLGTLVMPRMAGLALTLTDGTSGQGIGDATVRLQCGGGGLPVAEARGEFDADGTYVVWSGRSFGDYELDVTATGYLPTHQVGVLVAGDGPQPLELILERTR